MYSEDMEVEDLVKIFDIAMASKNPAVKKAFKNLMLIATIAQSESKEPIYGPLTSMQKEIAAMRADIRFLQNQLSQLTVNQGAIGSGGPNQYTQWVNYNSTAVYDNVKYHCSTGSAGIGK